MSKITEVAELVEKGKAKLVGAAVQGALDEGCDATEILSSMIDAMAGCWGEVQKRRDLCSGNAGSSTCHEKRCGGSETASGNRSNRKYG